MIQGGLMDKRKFWLIFWVLGAAIFALSACTTTADFAPPQEPSAPDAAESGPVVEEQPQEEAQPAAEEPLPRVPREGLEATDPTTVVLASGQPQLVEFFAFW
jgi:hypothetical protein